MLPSPGVDCAVRAAAGAVHVEPWHARNQRRPDRWRPQHVSTGGKLLIPAIDDGLCLGARGAIGHLPLGFECQCRARPSWSPWRQVSAESAAIQPGDIGAEAGVHPRPGGPPAPGDRCGEGAVKGGEAADSWGGGACRRVVEDDKTVEAGAWPRTSPKLSELLSPDVADYAGWRRSMEPAEDPRMGLALRVWSARAAKLLIPARCCPGTTAWAARCCYGSATAMHSKELR